VSRPATARSAGPSTGSARRRRSGRGSGLRNPFAPAPERVPDTSHTPSPPARGRRGSGSQGRARAARACSRNSPGRRTPGGSRRLPSRPCSASGPVRRSSWGSRGCASAGRPGGGRGSRGLAADGPGRLRSCSASAVAPWPARAGAGRAPERVRRPWPRGPSCREPSAIRRLPCWSFSRPRARLACLVSLSSGAVALGATVLGLDPDYRLSASSGQVDMPEGLC